MATIVTVGYGGVQVPVLIDHLKRARVSTVVDVRLIPQSKSAPAYCQEALARALDGAGLGYVHDSQLGNPLMEVCKRERTLAPYRAYLKENPQVLDFLRVFLRRLPIALLCGCPRADRCHRGVLAELLRAEGHEVVHLRPPQGKVLPPKSAPLYGITLAQPWPWAVAWGGWRVLYLDRVEPPAPGTYLALHASDAYDEAAAAWLTGRLGELEEESDQLGVPEDRRSPTEIPPPGKLHRGHIIALARFRSLLKENSHAERYGTGVRWWLDHVVPIEPVPRYWPDPPGLWLVDGDLLRVLRERFAAARARPLAGPPPIIETAQPGYPWSDQ